MKPPADFGPNDMALWTEIFALKHITASDRPSVERFVRLEGEAAALRASVGSDGAVIEKPIQTSGGKVLGTEAVPHACLMPLRKLGGEIQLLANALGLTPEGRAKLQLPDERKPDLVDALRDRRAKRMAAQK